MPERVLRLGIDSGPAIRGGRQFDRAADSAIASALGLNKAVLKTAIGVTAVGAALVGATAALGKFAQAGGRQLTVQAAFSRRVGDSESALVKLRAATSGLVTDMELMTQANQSLTLGSARTVDEFAELASTAQTLGRALGLDVAFALNSLNIGIARQSRLVLDNVGLIVSASEANRKYAAALGVTVDQLSDAQKQEAFRVEAITQARRKTEELGETTLNAGDAFTGFNTELANTVDHFSRMVAQSDAVAAFFNDAARAVRGLRGDLEDLNAERVHFLETGGTAMSPGEAADARLITSGRRAGGATQFGARGSGVAHLAEMFEDARKRMEELGATTEESFEDMVARVRDFESEMARLEFQLQVTGDQIPRVISEFEALYGFRGPTRTPLSDGQSALFDPDLVRGHDRRTPEGRNEFEEWVRRTAENLEPLASAADESADSLGDFAKIFKEGLTSFDAEAFTANLGANLASDAITTVLGGIADGLFGGDDYVSALEENTRALKELSGDTGDVLQELLDAGALGAFGDLRQKVEDEIAALRFSGAMDLARRRAGATDATPEEEFDLLRAALAGSLSGPLAEQVGGLTTENIEQFLVGLLDQIEAGTLDPKLLGSLSVDQVLDVVGDLERLGDAAEGAGKGLADLTQATIQALNAPRALNLALLGYRASLTGGPVEGSIDGTPFLPGRGAGGGPGTRPPPDQGGGGVPGNRGGVVLSGPVHMEFNISGAKSPRETAEEVVREIERQTRLGGGNPMMDVPVR